MNNKQNVQLLCRVLSAIDNPKDLKLFLDDVCTIKEIDSISQRLEVAFMLEGGMTFNEIVAKTGASSATISRVNKCLNYGKGYAGAIKKFKETENSSK